MPAVEEAAWLCSWKVYGPGEDEEEDEEKGEDVVES